MVPRSIIDQLGQLRRREVLLRVVWGTARCLAVIFVALLIACLIDYAVDRDQDTPWGLRLGLSLVHSFVFGFVVAFFLIRPLVGGKLGDNELALQVEDKHPELQHRLISAVQLNQPGADTQGMSPELIARVTREAEKQSGRISFTQAADSRRWGWSAAVAGPVLAVGLLLLVIWPDLVGSLLARQLLLDRDIPRAYTLVSVGKEVYPMGEQAVLRFHITGPDVDQQTGTVLVQPDGLPADRYLLELEKANGGSGHAVFVAKPYSTADFTFQAWLGDGRTRKPLRVRFVPRPVVTDLIAWVLLPPYCDYEGKKRYAVLQPRGDIVGIKGSMGKVQVKIQKPIASGFIEILRQTQADPEKVVGQMPEIVHRKVDLVLDDTKQIGMGSFDVLPEDSGYRVVVADEYGFVNVPPPRRALNLVEEEPPQVSLLPEVLPPLVELGPGEDVDVEGMPVLLGGSIPIAYTATGPYGLGQARMLFRLLKKKESGNENAPEEKWIPVPLPEIGYSKEKGLFDPKRGVFAKSGPRDKVYFHAMPAFHPDLLGRTLGGGRFDFLTTGIVDDKANTISLKEGDQIEYCIEVFADKKASPLRPSARSETRVKTIVSLAELERWIGDNVQEVRRIRELDAKQKGVFEK
jgi:hypothetical protein